MWPLSDNCPGHYEHGKFMLTKQQLIHEESWEVRRFYLWYMEAAKRGMKEFVVKVPAYLFHSDADAEIIIDFHDMYRLLR